MSNLQCHVSSCTANCNGGCSLSSIKVEGPAANQSKETVCGSYHKRCGGTNAANAAQQMHPTVDVGCTAAVCCFNKAGHCDSPQVLIDCNCGCGDRSECVTFRL